MRGGDGGKRNISGPAHVVMLLDPSGARFGMKYTSKQSNHLSYICICLQYKLTGILYIHTYVCVKNIEKNHTSLPQHVSHASETIFQAFSFFRDFLLGFDHRVMGWA